MESARTSMAHVAIVIIDVQNAILGASGTDRNAKNHAALDEVVARIARLIRRGRELGVPILFVQHDGPPGHRLESGTEGWQIRPEISPVEGEPVIHKSACDSFFETTLGAELESRGIGRLIVAGCMTQYCVDTTVRRAVSLGYDVTLVADGHMTEDSGALGFEQIIDHHNALLDGFDAGRHSVTVVLCDSVLALQNS
jgi:nicotinamidase-related amidase